MKNLLKTVAVVVVLLAVLSACATTGESTGAAATRGAAEVADDGSMMLITGANSNGWNPEFGGLSMRNGVLTFTTVRQGDTYMIAGRHRFSRRTDISAFAEGYLQMEIMVSDDHMLDCIEATMTLSSADFNYMKWKFNEIGRYEDGLSSQVPTEPNVWTTVTVPLYANSWEDAFITNGLNYSRVERFDFFMSGIPVDGTIHFRNIRAVQTP